jgi:23S rRNA (adenine1618-N6)-methyltransferase
MDAKIKSTIPVKNELHHRNVHKDRYDFEELCAALPELSAYVMINKYEDTTIDFSDAAAVKCLNQALLKYYYEIEKWDIPQGYLCPPIPSRADYIHYIADVLANANNGVIPVGKNIKILDIGVGANCIFPILGHQIYGWQFVGSEIDGKAVDNACLIVAENNLRHAIIIRKQTNKTLILNGIISESDRFDMVLCNPPFHSSMQDVLAGAQRKWRGLDKKNKVDTLNFGGQNNELWCKGGERAFIEKMIIESRLFTDQVKCFSTLVSKDDHLAKVYRCLETAKANKVQTIEMGQGQKKSRIVVWGF